jgi:cell filamentation protein
LHQAERDYSSIRQAEIVKKGVTGDFSMKHLCSIHRQLFQDIYTWAGKTRTVDISKGTIFCLVQFIDSQFDDMYRKLKKENFLKDITDKREMAVRLAYYLGELNMIHPFREGNGRTQRIYIEQLCLNNGRFEIDFTEVTKDEMIAASVRSANASNDLLEELLFKCLVDQ